MENNKQTAVDWLKKLYEERPESILIDEDFEKAKEMEIEEHRETFKQARKANIFEKDMPPVWESFEQYYNETFKNQSE
jgi:hypothetical protein